MNLEISFAPLLDMLLKSAVLLLVGAVLHAAMRKASAANRHVILVAIFATLLLLPLTKLFAPRWSVAMEPDAAATVRVDLARVVFIEASASTESALPQADTVGDARVCIGGQSDCGYSRPR
jgi:hypothetical protein